MIHARAHTTPIHPPPDAPIPSQARCTCSAVQQSSTQKRLPHLPELKAVRQELVPSPAVRARDAPRALCLRALLVQGGAAVDSLHNANEITADDIVYKETAGSK